MSLILTLIWTVLAVCTVLGVIGIIVTSREGSEKLEWPVPGTESTGTASVAPARVLTPTEHREAVIARVRAQWR
jgi:hypothetical protein